MCCCPTSGPGPEMEQVLQLPDDGGAGILTPAHGTSNRAAVVLFNAGLIHRCGPQRFHVDLARRLAARGFHVLRFDLPGIGDGLSVPALSPADAAVRALDAVQAATGVSHFIVGGICSAADLGWRVAVADERVRGVLMVDGMVVGGRWQWIGQLQMALHSPPRHWPAKLLRWVRRGEGAGGGAPTGRADDVRDWPTPGAFRDQAVRLLDRGVRVFALYTGGVADYLLHPRQVDATFGAARRHPHLRVSCRWDMDHIFFALRHRREAVQMIEAWAADAFGRH